jgi:hypothetical protein
MNKLFCPLLAAALGVAGCSETEEYSEPAADARQGVEPQLPVAQLDLPREKPVGRYDVPAQSPHGRVVITSFGVHDMQVGQQEKPVRFLHVRMQLTNTDDTGPWTFDVRQQLLALPNEGQSQPALINADQRDLPNLSVAPGQTRTVDLYYALPQTLQTAREIPAGDLSWHVQTPGQTIAQRTPIEEQRPNEPGAQYSAAAQPSGTYGAEQAPMTTDGDYAAYPPYAYPYPSDYWGLGFGWAPIWWFNPFFPAVTFVHPVFFHNHVFLAHHPFVAPHAVHSFHTFHAHNAFVSPHVHAFAAHGVGVHGVGVHGGRMFAAHGSPGAVHVHGAGFHGGGFHGGGFHGGGFGGGGFHGGGGGFHGGGGGFHGGGGGFGGGGHGGGGGGHR